MAPVLVIHSCHCHAMMLIMAVVMASASRAQQMFMELLKGSFCVAVSAEHACGHQNLPRAPEVLVPHVI
eukprot:11875855-Alexandrium_andersonii.AAC.1